LEIKIQLYLACHTLTHTSKWACKWCTN